MRIKQYQKSRLNDFIANYEMALISNIHSSQLEKTNNGFKYSGTNFVDYTAIEVNFIQEVTDYLIRSSNVLMNYFQHCTTIGKYDPEERYTKTLGENYIFEYNDKIIYLNRRLFQLGVNKELETFKFDIEKLKNENDEIDLSNTKGTEKIIYLHQLGIIDFLREKEPFNYSTNALATAISAITGISQGTAQSYLNPISNPGAGQDNNPLNSTKKVEGIKQTLINLGFKPQE